MHYNSEIYHLRSNIAELRRHEADRIEINSINYLQPISQYIAPSIAEIMVDSISQSNSDNGPSSVLTVRRSK
jgi:hypothetical protein